VWEYQTSPLYSPAERTTLDFAIAAASVPNAVTDAMFTELRKYWTEEQIVEIVGVISLFGFLNRWNDTLATPLEDEPIAVGKRTGALTSHSPLNYTICSRYHALRATLSVSRGISCAVKLPISRFALCRRSVTALVGWRRKPCVTKKPGHWAGFCNLGW
jgi:hypothetical protein